jgi:hypothetical protein
MRGPAPTQTHDRWSRAIRSHMRLGGRRARRQNESSLCHIKDSLGWVLAGWLLPLAAICGGLPGPPWVVQGAGFGGWRGGRGLYGPAPDASRTLRAPAGPAVPVRVTRGSLPDLGRGTAGRAVPCQLSAAATTVDRGGGVRVGIEPDRGGSLTAAADSGSMSAADWCSGRRSAGCSCCAFRCGGRRGWLDWHKRSEPTRPQVDAEPR